MKPSDTSRTASEYRSRDPRFPDMRDSVRFSLTGPDGATYRSAWMSLASLDAQEAARRERSMREAFQGEALTWASAGRPSACGAALIERLAP